MNDNINTPKHVAIIMDGNGRWAKKRLLPRTAGHKAAVSQVRKTIQYAAKNKIQTLTLFAWGRENWNRPKDEVGVMMKLFIKVLTSEVTKLHENNIQLKILGDRSRVSEKIVKLINLAEVKTAANKGLKLKIAFDYSGCWDIVEASKRIAQSYKSGEIKLDQINDTFFEKQLITKDAPPIDLLIRTSGEQRISNFMLWQLAYSELYFTNTLWPDFDENEFKRALEDYNKRQRRFGKITEQL